MPQPFDYTFGQQGPSMLEFFGGGFNAGYGISDVFQQKKSREAQAQAQAERQAQFQEAWSKATGPNGTSRDIANALMLAEPKKAKVLQTALTEMTSDRRREVAAQAGAIYSAASSGNKKVTKQLIQELAEASKNSGKIDMANMYNALAATADVNLDYVAQASLPFMLFSEEGLEVYAEVNDRLKDVMDAKGAGADMSAFEEKVQALMAVGYTREEAVKEVAGAIKTIANPVTGNVEVVEPATGQLSTLATNQEFGNVEEETASELPEGQESLWDIASDNRVTGIATGVAQKAQNVIGSALPGVSVMDPDLQVKVDRFTKVQNDLTRSFRQGDRFTATEQKRLLQELNIEPGMMTDIQTLRSKLTSVYGYLESLAQQNLEKMQNPRLPAKERGTAAAKYSDIIQSMALVGNPNEEQQSSEIPEGVEPELWEFMTEEERALFQ